MLFLWLKIITPALVILSPFVLGPVLGSIAYFILA